RLFAFPASSHAPPCRSSGNEPRWRTETHESDRGSGRRQTEVDDSVSGLAFAAVGSTIAGADHDRPPVFLLLSKIHLDMGDPQFSTPFLPDAFSPEKQISRKKLRKGGGGQMI